MRLLDSMRCLPNMTEATYDLVAQVPEGKVTTYGEVAKALGDIVASRFVGVAMSQNPDIVRVPGRRVVQSDGYVRGYTRRWAVEEDQTLERGRNQNIQGQDNGF